MQKLCREANDIGIDADQLDNILDFDNNLVKKANIELEIKTKKKILDFTVEKQQEINMMN